MAKQPRMGRNLNALLGGAARERTGRSSPDEEKSQEKERSSADSAASSSESHSTIARGDNAVIKSEPRSDVAQSVPADKLPEASLVGVEVQAVVSKPAKDAIEQSKLPGDSDPAVGQGSGERLIMLGVEKIRRGTYQPRRLFDPELLQELADSIKAQGMIQPIIVRPFADGFELVAGERRWRAAQLAGMDRIPAIVRTMEDRSVAAVSVIENIQRKELNPLEEAAAFERLCDEFGMTHKAVAEAVGRSRASVTNLMRLLELHDEVKVMVDKGELEMGHARALLGAPRPKQPDIARRVIKQSMTVRAVEQYVRTLDAEGNEVPTPSKDAVSDPDIERLSQKLGDKLGAKVQITHKGNGAGKLQISYSSVSELQGILAHIK